MHDNILQLVMRWTLFCLYAL